MKLPAPLRAAFTLDGRSLAAARIGLAVLVLVELALRARDLEAHYADSGVLPRAALLEHPAGLSWSFHALGGSVAFQAALFVLTAGCAVALLLGWRTFAATVAVWALTTSLHGRNPFLRDGQDDLLRVLLFWGTFLPWGMRWSLDRARGRRAHPLQPDPAAGAPPAVLSAGTACLVLQLCLMYWAAGASKLVSPWWASGDAMSFALDIARYQTALGAWLLRFPRLLRAASQLTVVVELGLPLLLFVPVKRDAARAAVVTGFVLLHLAFGLCLRLGSFALVGAAAWLALLPGPFWEQLAARVPALARRRAGAAAAPALPPPRPVVHTVLAPLAAALAGGCLLAATVLNAENVAPRAPLPKWVAPFCEAIGLQQIWGVFAPPVVTPVVTRDGWFIVPGTLASGAAVDLLTRAPVTRARPASVADTFGNARWRHWFANVMMYDAPPSSSWWIGVKLSREAYGRFVCRRWNAAAAPDARLVRFSVIYLVYQMRIGPGGAVANGPVEELKMFEHACE
jgi:hypothetical protein